MLQILSINLEGTNWTGVRENVREIAKKRNFIKSRQEAALTQHLCIIHETIGSNRSNVNADASQVCYIKKWDDSSAA